MVVRSITCLKKLDGYVNCNTDMLLVEATTDWEDENPESLIEDDIDPKITHAF